MAKCDVCGRTLSKINRSQGLELCNSCRGIMPGITRHMPELVKMIKAVGKEAELAEMLGLSAAASACSADARHALEAVVQDARATLIKALPPAPENIDDTQSLFDVATIAEEAARYISTISEERQKLEDQTRELAGLLGCPVGEVVPALRMMQGHVEAIRTIVEPEVAEDRPASLPEACRALVNRYHAARDAASGTADSNESAAEVEMLRELVAEKKQLAEEYCKKLNALEHGIALAMEGATYGTGNDPLENALLRWAIQQYQQGKVKVNVEVEVVE